MDTRRVGTVAVRADRRTDLTKLMGACRDHATFSRLMTYIYINIYIYIYIYMLYRTANLQSCILYIYSTNTRTEYFKHAAHTPFFPLQNAVYLIMLFFFGSCIRILNTGVLKFKGKFRRLKFNKGVN
jgi:hypothetical protein